MTDTKTIDPEQLGDATNALVEQVLQSDESDPRPDPPEVTDGQATLPGGVVLADGTVVRKAEVRELTGADEEILERPAIRSNPYRWAYTMLERCVESIGGEPVTADTLRDLLDGDAAMLIQAIRVVTYGDTLDVSALCPNCNHTFDVEYSLREDVPVRELAEEDRVLEVELKKGRVAEVMLPTLGDQLEITEVLDSDASRSERNHALLGRCLNRIDKRPVTGVSMVKQLPLADIRAMVRAIADKQPGPRYGDVQQECPRCGVKFPLIIGLEDLFRG